jgi:hypothetical protein
VAHTELGIASVDRARVAVVDGRWRARLTCTRAVTARDAVTDIGIALTGNARCDREVLNAAGRIASVGRARIAVVNDRRRGKLTLRGRVARSDAVTNGRVGVAGCPRGTGLGLRHTAGTDIVGAWVVVGNRRARGLAWAKGEAIQLIGGRIAGRGVDDHA